MNPNLKPDKRFEVTFDGIKTGKYFLGYQYNQFMRRMRLALGELNITHTL